MKLIDLALGDVQDINITGLSAGAWQMPSAVGQIGGSKPGFPQETEGQTGMM